MQYKIPYYYRQFSCAGSACPDTCCGGWRIQIDEKSYRNYMQVPGAFGARLRKGIDRKDRSFRLRNRACTLLDQEGLCRIYKELGKDAMCRACRIYPRHREDYGQVQELMLSLSCPEAARLILEDTAQGAFLEWTRQENPSVSQESDPVCDPELLRCLEEVRLTMVCLLKDRSMDWSQRLAMILAYAHDFQRHLYLEGTEADVSSLADKWNRRYLDREAVPVFREKLEPYEGRSRERMLRISGWMRDMQKLEPVLADWEKKQGSICTALYHKEIPDSYERLERQFAGEAAGLEQAWENLALYFLRTWLLGAVYDRDVYGKVKLVVVSCLVIREWCLFRYRKTGQIRQEDLVAAAYRYSRQVENWDRNLGMLEYRLGTSPLYALASMLTVLWGGKGKHGD